MPAVPGSRFIMIETELILGRFETIFNGPALAFNLDQGGDAGTGWTPGREEGQFAIGDRASD